MGGRAGGGKSLRYAGREGTDAAPEAGPLKQKFQRLEANNDWSVCDLTRDFGSR